MLWRLVMVLGWVGCTASHGAPPIDEATFLAEVAVLDCERELRCEPYGGRAGRCHPEAYALTSYGAGGCPSTFHPHAAVRCLEGLASDGCSPDARAVTELACSGVYSAPPPPGSSCDRWECGEDEVCRAAPGCVGIDCPWACRPRGGIGEACTRVTRSGGSLGGLAGLGASLAPECAEGLDCVAPSSGAWPPVCSPPTAIGDACGMTGCSAGQSCVAGSCARVDRVGDPCTSDCGEGLRCAAASDGGFRCAPRLAEGEACVDPCEGSPLCWGSACDEGLRCDGGVCVAVSGPGEACGEASVCPAGFHCDGAVCAADPIEGEACTEAVGCARGVCRAGTCVLLEGGEVCERDLLETSSGLGDCEGQCFEGSCLALRREGEACDAVFSMPTAVCERGTRCDFTEMRCVAAEEVCR